MQSSNLGLPARMEGGANVPPAPMEVFGMSLGCTWLEARQGRGEQ